MSTRDKISQKSKEALEPSIAFVPPKFAQPISLDKYFDEYISNIHDCLHFLERFSDDDETISKLVAAYIAYPNKFSSNFSLDLLCEAAEVEPNVFRRLLIATMDFLCSDDADMAIRLSKGSLVRKSLEKAMGDDPEAYAERKAWLEFIGYRVVNKNTQLINVNVNSNNQQQVGQQLIVNGLPSMSSSIADSEKIGSQTIKGLLEKKHTNVIDIETKKEVLENV
jgi:hypothetical protein